MRTVRSLVADSASTIDRYGAHPLLLSRAVAHRLRVRSQQRRLREHYAAIVAVPRGRAALRAPAIDLPPAEQLPAALQEPAARVREEAEMALAHVVDLLGSGPVELGPRIDWQRDFKSGYRWSPAFYQDVEITRLYDDSDAKVPWELSRGHQLLTLARAARLYHDERFAAELERQLDSWLQDNPAGVGINWVTPMEAAIRAVNWGWAIGTLEGWRPLDGELRIRVARSLQAHGRHIERNLEGSPLLRGNHYLADVLGLLALARMLPTDPRAGRWRRFARKALEREITTQVGPDGVGFEASLPYHGLSLEMFLVAWHLASADGRGLSSRYRVQLMRMLEVSRSVRHPDGRSPVVGDQDSGRVLPASFARPATHDNLLDLGAALLGGLRPRDAAPGEEVAWTLGIDRWQALARRPVDLRPPSTAFPDGGLYVLHAAGVHMVVRWGGVGQNGNGGHAHNDLSSYELSCGAPLVVDSGTYVYTADLAARDAFRSATAHNVLVVDGRDMHPLPDAAPFRLPQHARFEVEEWRNDAGEIVLVGSHDGFRRDGSTVRCRRRIVVERATGVIEIVDKATGRGRHACQSLLHLAPGWTATGDGRSAVVVTGPAAPRRIEFAGAAAIEIEPGWVSSAYGVRERAPRIRASTSAELPITISYRIVPA